MKKRKMMMVVLAIAIAVANLNHLEKKEPATALVAPKQKVPPVKFHEIETDINLLPGAALLFFISNYQ